MGRQAGADTDPGPRFRPTRPVEKGVGGQGIIYEAEDEQFGRVVALKQVRDEDAGSPEHRDCLNFEATIVGRLEHPSIIPAYARGRLGDGRPFYAMRLIRGRSLLDAIAEHHQPPLASGDTGGDRRTRSLLDLQRARSMRELLNHFVAVCRAVQYAHDRRVMHGDLKPGNVMLRREYGETLVIDWGMARLLEPSGGSTRSAPIFPRSGDGDFVTVLGRVGGTLQYMSPEHADGKPDRPSDIFGLGAILYQILTGRPPYPPAGELPGGQDALWALARAGDYRELTPGRPREHAALKAVALKAMSRRVADRYPSAGELADDVRRWLDDEPVLARREPAPERAARMDAATQAARGRDRRGPRAGLRPRRPGGASPEAPVRSQGRLRRRGGAMRRLQSEATAAGIKAELESERADYHFGLTKNATFGLLRTLHEAQLPRAPESERLRLDVGALLVRESEEVLGGNLATSRSRTA